MEGPTEREDAPCGPSLFLVDVARIVRGRVVAGEDVQITGVAPIDEAVAGSLAFLAGRRYLRHITACQATAYLVSAELEESLPPGAARVVVQEPWEALRRLLLELRPAASPPASIHATAVLGSGVELGVGVTIEPYAVLEEGARVGDGSRIGAHAVIGRFCTVGAACRLHPHVVLYEGTSVGNGVTIHSGARVGVDGFGYVTIEGEHRKIPQVGRCVIEDDVEIGANATIDRGSLTDTRIGQGSKLDNLVHIAHNVRVGARSLLAALVGVAGSTRLGKGVWMGGQSGAVNGLEIGDGARVAVQTGVTRDVASGETVSGFPGRPHREELRWRAEAGRLPALRARVAQLEAQVERLRRERASDRPGEEGDL
jgi:UDP-3-O-[3-hydroxymyristoyl] glucosamine N-acyltransferase